MAEAEPGAEAEVVTVEPVEEVKEEEKVDETVEEEASSSLMSPEKEEELAASMMCMALNLFPEMEWVDKKRSDELTVQYAYVIEEDDDETTAASSGKKKTVASICTTRGETRIPDFSPKEYFEFMENHTEDEEKFQMENDPMCEEVTVIKHLDVDRAIVHARFNSGSWAARQVVWNRDFCYLARRMFFKDHTITHLPDGRELETPKTFAEICLGLTYSIPEEHADCCKADGGHVRGQLKYAGYCFFREKQSDSDCRMVYLMKMDPKGWLPTWVVNIVGAGQGKVVSAVKANIDAVRQVLQRRAEEKEKATASC